MSSLPNTGSNGSAPDPYYTNGMKIIAPLIALAIFVVVAVYAIFQMGLFDTPVQAEKNEWPKEIVPGEESPGSEQLPISVETLWDFRFIEDGVSDVMVPQTDVGISFREGGVVEGPYRLGSFTGSCSEQTPSGGEIAHALCWYAGFGTEFSVVQEGRAVHVLSAEVEEGTPEYTPPPTEYSTILSITL